MGNRSMKQLQNKIRSLPDSPGVYLFKDASGEVIYIGKAGSLKKRVASYFSRPQNEKNQALVSKISGLEYVVTVSEPQAQILEASLIKKNLPQYNISLKDDKSFPFIRISADEFPILSVCRRKKVEPLDGSQYIGPYTSAKLLREALKEIRRIFGYCSCQVKPKRPCLYHHLGLCPGPWSGKVSREEYQENIEEIKLFLESRHEELLRRLTRRMEEASKKRDYESAGRIRDKIRALGILSQIRPLSKSDDELADLKSLLGLIKYPERIEAFDISNISGKEATGSMVSFHKGAPDKNNYRRFRIKGVEGINDYKMLAEVVGRRYRRLKEEGGPFPDLVLIDGGKSHLLVADQEMRKLGLELPIVSIAKDKENIYVKGRRYPIRLKEDTLALNLIRRVRDEAHRFAVAYHHILRRKKIIGK